MRGQKGKGKDSRGPKPKGTNSEAKRMWGKESKGKDSERIATERQLGYEDKGKGVMHNEMVDEKRDLEKPGME